MNFDDKYMLECLPDYLAEAIDIILAAPREEIPRIDLIEEYSKALYETIKTK
jgi:hypothetical protein